MTSSIDKKTALNCKCLAEIMLNLKLTPSSLLATFRLKYNLAKTETKNGVACKKRVKSAILVKKLKF